MNCQHMNCDYTGRHWVTKGGRAKKVCDTHLQSHLDDGWSIR